MLSALNREKNESREIVRLSEMDPNEELRTTTLSFP